MHLKVKKELQAGVCNIDNDPFSRKCRSLPLFCPHNVLYAFEKKKGKTECVPKMITDAGKTTYPSLTSSKTLLIKLSIPRLLIHNLKHLSSLDVCTSSVILSAKDIVLELFEFKPFLQSIHKDKGDTSL